MQSGLASQQIICTGPTEVDGCDRDAAARRHLREAKAGQRRTDDKHCVCLFYGCLRRGYLVAWNVFGEENDVGFEYAAARSARRHSETRKVEMFEVCIATG